MSGTFDLGKLFIERTSPLRGGDFRGSNFFFLLFHFFKVNLPIYITFALLKYNTKGNFMFYQSISVKHRLFVMCFSNIRIDVDDGFLCLVTAV